MSERASESSASEQTLAGAPSGTQTSAGWARFRQASSGGGHGGDFDTVLERLLTEPSFAQALAADPAAALAGYRLTAEEVSLLSSQVSADAGGQRAVETRVNKSSVFGLLSPLAGLAGTGGLTDHLGSGSGETVGNAAAGGAAAAVSVAGTGGSGPIGASLDSTLGGGTQGFGTAGEVASGGAGGVADAGVSVGGQPQGQAGFGQRGEPQGRAGFGAAPQGHAGFGQRGEPQGRGGFGAAPPGQAGLGAAPQPDGVRSPHLDGFRPPPEGYHTRVDVDGDGDWDRHILVGRRDGGVDILVDTDRDGRADFVGHDVDGDRLVDSADYDKNHDGTFEKTMYDDDGDGWLDRRTVRR